jgi:two-component system osmolarity sensor histidine kinase EnvZ
MPNGWNEPNGPHPPDALAGPAPGVGGAADMRRASLAQQHLRWLLSLFGALTALIMVSVLGFVLLPLAERSADDLAALMVLSAQTWVELPPDTRPAFEAELLRQHQLALRADLALPAEGTLRHGFYIGFVEQALQHRNGAPRR